MLNTIVSYSAAGYMLRERGGGERGGERGVREGVREGGERGGRILFPLLTYSIYTDVSSGRI